MGAGYGERGRAVSGGRVRAEGAGYGCRGHGGGRGGGSGGCTKAPLQLHDGGKKKENYETELEWNKVLKARQPKPRSRPGVRREFFIYPCGPRR